MSTRVVSALKRGDCSSLFLPPDFEPGLAWPAAPACNPPKMTRNAAKRMGGPVTRSRTTELLTTKVYQLEAGREKHLGCASACLTTSGFTVLSQAAQNGRGANILADWEFRWLHRKYIPMRVSFWV